MKNSLVALAVMVCAFFSSTTVANEVEIVKVMIEPAAHRWTFHVTLNHADKDFKHYADGWRIVDKDGNELGYRKLWHPHEKQPFTRSLGNVLIPKGNSIIFIEAHDNVHGWSKQRVKINLKEEKGNRYQIRRKN